MMLIKSSLPLQEPYLQRNDIRQKSAFAGPEAQLPFLVCDSAMYIITHLK